MFLAFLSCKEREESRQHVNRAAEERQRVLMLFENQVIPETPVGLPGDSMVQTACQCRRCGFDPWVEKIPGRRKWQPTPVFLPGKSHGQRSLAGYIPWCRKESDTAKCLEHSPARETRVPPCSFPGFVFLKDISLNFVTQPHSRLR